MNRPLLLILSLLGFCLAPTVRAQTGEDVLRYSQRFPAVGARMTGMAGAGVGGVNDWGATFVNPAGLGLVVRSHVAGSIAVNAVESEADYFGARSDASAVQATLGSGAYVYAAPALRGALVFGVGYSETAAFGRELSFGGVNPDVPGGVVGLRQFGDVFESGQAGELSLAGAVEVAPRMLAGLSFNLIGGEYEVEQYLDGFVGDDGRPAGADDYIRADLRGVNLRAGVVGEVAPGVRLGLAAETPTYYRVEESYDLESTGDYCDVCDYSITTPWRVAGGIAYEMAGFLLTADLEYLDWSQARLRPTNTYLEADLDIRRNYREVFNTRFGAEYAIGPWAVRAGAAYQPDPLRDVLEIDREQTTYAIGFSLQATRRTVFDVAYAYTEFADQIVPASGFGVVAEEVVRNRFLVGVQVNL